MLRILFKSNSTIPDWIQINEARMSFNVSTTLIKSVSVITLTLQAQLVAYTIPNNYENYATQITDAVFNFTNSNCELLYVNSSSYFVINTLTQFYIHFFRWWNG